jgi:hypothetical protein
VNTEVDYREEDDSILVDPDDEPVLSNGKGKCITMPTPLHHRQYNLVGSSLLLPT